ncbi:MAG: sigma factor-like helix-turn-helix DNA-binding protein [Solirubrobacteraceae bacterium]
MIRLEQLPPDQRAVLSLLLRQRKGYEEVASILGVAPEAVHDRAHAALAVLAPAQARLVDAAQRERIGEYLLGQQSDQGAAATKTYLAGSTPAREWARALAVELVKLASEAMPEIPDAQASPPAPASPAVPRGGSSDDGGSQPVPSPVSRRGGALLLTGIVLVVAVVVAIVLSSGGGSGNGNQAASRSSEQTTTSTTGSAGQSSSKSSGESSKVKVEKLAEMKPVSGGGSAKGYAAIVAKGSTHAVEIEANGLAPTEGFSYVVWLTGSKGEFSAIGRVPSVNSSGHFRVIEALAQAASSVAGIEITRETSAHPSSPGSIVLKGSFVGA